MKTDQSVKLLGQLPRLVMPNILYLWYWCLQIEWSCMLCIVKFNHVSKLLLCGVQSYDSFGSLVTTFLLSFTFQWPLLTSLKLKNYSLYVLWVSCEKLFKNCISFFSPFFTLFNHFRIYLAFLVFLWAFLIFYFFTSFWSFFTCFWQCVLSEI